MEQERQAIEEWEELNENLRKHQKIAMNRVLIKTALCVIQAAVFFFSVSEEVNPLSLSLALIVMIFLVYTTSESYREYRAWKKTPFMKRSFRS